MPAFRRLAALALLAPLAACSTGGGPGASPTAPVREAGRTTFVPHAGVPFDGASRNGVWCATFPLAWHALGTEVLGGPVLLGPPAPADLVEGMNGRPFPAAALDPASRVVVAGRYGDGVLDRIRREGREKFGLDLPRSPLAPGRPEDLLAYAFLRKDLPFAVPFEPFEEGIAFPGAAGRVPAFGIHGDSGAADLDAMRGQTTVLFHGAGKSGEDMAIEIRTERGDILVLAAVPPAASLEAAWRSVLAIPRAAPGPILEGEVLAVPKIHFDLAHRFAEFPGAPLRNPGFEGFRVTEAMQSVLLRLDEAGVLLESEAVFEARLSMAPAKRRFVFDRPFLLALREAGAAEPYLLLWVANPDLMPR
jgi:hypothetical protein